MYDLVGLLAPAVPALEDGAVLVGDLGAARDGSPDERPVLGHELFGQRPLARFGKQPIEDQAQVRIDVVPVEPNRLVVGRVVGEHGGKPTERILRCI